MPKVASKLFREPSEAKAAVDQLKAKGFKAEDIVVVANAKRAKELGAGVKAVPDTAKLAAMGVPEDTISYYQYSMSSGAIVVGVQAADENHAAQAQQLLRKVAHREKTKPCATSPGFGLSGRMSATNPIDAPMSGDFRRY